MRSLDALRELVRSRGIEPGLMTRTELMNALRGPSLMIDPAKAQDLKRKIAWGTEHPFDGISAYLTPDWILEPKLDGVRMRLFMGEESNHMTTGRRSDLTFDYIERGDNFPHLRDSVVPELAGTVLDGELMPPSASLTTESGVVTRGTLNSAMALVNVDPAKSVATQAREGLAVFWVFDILSVRGEDVMRLTFQERRGLLLEVALTIICAGGSPLIAPVPWYDATADNIELLLQTGHEGGMLKRRDSIYVPGKRMATWQKVKRMSTGDFYVIGSVPGTGRNLGMIGSLKVAYMGDDGRDVYCADVGGIDDQTRARLTGSDGGVSPTYLRSVVEVMGQGRTKNRRIRHPHLVRLRPDKRPEDCDVSQFTLFDEV